MIPFEKACLRSNWRDGQACEDYMLMMSDKEDYFDTFLKELPSFFEKYPKRTCNAIGGFEHGVLRVTLSKSRKINEHNREKVLPMLLGERAKIYRSVFKDILDSLLSSGCKKAFEPKYRFLLFEDEFNNKQYVENNSVHFYEVVCDLHRELCESRWRIDYNLSYKAKRPFAVEMTKRVCKKHPDYKFCKGL